MALVEYIEQWEEESGEEIELDVVALRCEWAEYGSAISAALAYCWESPAISEDWDAAALAWLHERTTVLELPSGGVVIQQF